MAHKRQSTSEMTLPFFVFTFKPVEDFVTSLT
jgi:hypothetical protein